MLSILGLGPSEILLILLFVVILLVGPKKIPEFFRAIGQSVGEFKAGVKESKEEEEKAKKKTTKKKKKSKKK
jgi:sec-independent protein translocase protein TatA